MTDTPTININTAMTDAREPRQELARSRPGAKAWDFVHGREVDEVVTVPEDPYEGMDPDEIPF